MSVAGGAIFGYMLVFPEAFTVLLGFSDETLVATLFVKDYMPFFRRMLLAFGIGASGGPFIAPW